MPIFLRPAPSWSVFERLSVSMSLPHALDVAAIERHDFRVPKSASEADQEQRPVARVVRGVGRSDGADRMNLGPRGY